MKIYDHQPSKVDQNFHGVPFLPGSQLLPGTGSNKLQFLHSTEVRYFTHERSNPCCTTERSFPSTLPMAWGPVDDPSQSLPFLATPHRTRPTSRTTSVNLHSS